MLVLIASGALAASIAAPGVVGGVDAGAATPNPSAIRYNPAAIAAGDGVQLLLDGQAALIDITATATRNGGIDPNTGEAYAPADASVMVPVFFLGGTGEIIKDRLTVGLSVDDPFVGGGKYLDEDGEPDVHTHGRYHGVDVTLLSLAITPAVAVTVVDGLHLGVGGSYNIDHVSALQAADPLGTEGIAPEELGSSPPANPYAYDVLLSLSATGGHIGWNAGVFFDKWKQLQIGASYQSGGTFHAAGDATVSVPAALSTTAEAKDLPAQADFSMKLPSVARLYVNSQINDKLLIGAGVDYEMWYVCCGSADGDVHIQVMNEKGDAIGPDDGVTLTIAKDQYNPSRLWNAASFALHGGYDVTDRLWVGLRGNYNQYAVPSYSVSPVNLDFENVAVLAGARYRLGDHLELGLTYGHVFLFTRTITDSAWNLQDGNDRFSPELPYKASANGVYSGSVNHVGLRVAASF